MSRVIIVSNIKTGVAGAVYDALTKDTPYDPSYSYIEYPSNGEAPYAEWEKFGDQWKSRGWESHMHFRPWANDRFDPEYSCRSCGEYISNQCEECSEKEWSKLRKKEMELENQNAIAKAIERSNAQAEEDKQRLLAEDALIKILGQRPVTMEDLLPDEQDYVRDYIKTHGQGGTGMAAMHEVQAFRAAKLAEIKKRRGII